MRRREFGEGGPAPARWHAGSLNNGLVFGATYQGVSRMPTWCSYGIAHVGTWIAYRTMREGTRAILHNLRVLQPDATERELNRLALATYRSYARDTIDFIRSLEMPAERLRSLISGDNWGALDPLLALGKGVVLIGAHFGNWELGGIVLRQFMNCPVTVVGRQEPSAAVGLMRRRMRERFGIESVVIGHMLETALHLRKLLATNTVVAMLIDRSFGRDCVEVSFFGRPTLFLRSPALVARLSGAPLLPASMIRQADGRFAGWFGTPVFVDPEDSSDAALRRAVQAVADQLEMQIRVHPSLWYQFYPYWAASSPELTVSHLAQVGSHE